MALDKPYATDMGLLAAILELCRQGVYWTAT